MLQNLPHVQVQLYLSVSPVHPFPVYWALTLCQILHEAPAAEIFVGTIKLQSLSLIYPDWAVEYTDENVDDVIFGLRSNPNFSSYLSASVGAINRAFALIEKNQLSGIAVKKIDFDTVKNQGSESFITLDDDIYKVNKVLKNGINVHYETVANQLIKVSLINSSDEIEVIYYKKIERINHLTGSNFEISLGGIEEFIPYFVKSELLGIENTEGEKSQKIFYDMLNKFGDDTDGGSHFETVYSFIQ